MKERKSDVATPTPTATVVVFSQILILLCTNVG